MGTDKKGRTGFDDTTAWADSQVCGYESDVGQVEDLRAVGKGHRPQLGRRTEDMDEALARTRADLRAIRDANEVVVSVIAVLVVEIFSRGYEQGLDGLSRLRRKSSATRWNNRTYHPYNNDVACRDFTPGRKHDGVRYELMGCAFESSACTRPWTAQISFCS